LDATPDSLSSKVTDMFPTSRIRLSNHAKAKKIVAGDTHTIVLDVTGVVHGFGKHDNGRLCNGNTTGVTYIPTIILVPNNVTIVDIAVGSDHSVLLDTMGIVYTCGKGDNGRLGNGNSSGDDPYPKQIQIPGNRKIVAIAAKFDYTLLLDDQGTPYGFGSGAYGKLGNIVSMDLSIDTRPLIPNSIFKYDYEVWSYTMVDSKGNQRKYSGEFLINVKMDSGFPMVSLKTFTFTGGFTDLTVPTIIQMPSGVVIKSIAAGDYYSMFLDSSGAVYASGRVGAEYIWKVEVVDEKFDNFRRAVLVSGPIATSDPRIAPTNWKVQKLWIDKKVNSIHAGHSTFMLIDTDGQVHAFGKNRYFGNGDFAADSVYPVQIYLSQDEADVKGASAALGKSYSLVLSDKGKLYSTGEGVSGQRGVYYLGGVSNIMSPITNVIYSCFGFVYTSASVCSNHGTCSSNDNCLCTSGYTGESCDTMVVVIVPITCFGTIQNSTSVCSGHGVCVGSDRCMCDRDYTGLDCSSPRTCNGVAFNSDLVCSGHGNCTQQGVCACIEEYFGSNCHVKETTVQCNETSCDTIGM
jgi:alpha-tubulin suppressor-like RCC1 family protein